MSAAWAPRAAQAEILAYTGGRMGVSAVPGSGKTATIAALAARLIAAGIAPGQRVLVVTYQNAAANALAARIGARLSAEGLPRRGYEVRTLHGLAHGIVSEQAGLAGLAPGFGVADEALVGELLDRARRAWKAAHAEDWEALRQEARLAGARDQTLARSLSQLGGAVIREAKNRRLTPEALDRHVTRAMEAAGEAEDPAAEPSPFLRIGAWIYRHYQGQLDRAGLVDFDDLVRLAVDLLERHEDLAAELTWRWPYVLEDEAQDSVPLQEALLGRLTEAAGEGPGNWVRVGDPNQAVTSSFTAAEPAALRRFLQRPEVQAVTMDESGRNARRIQALANHLVDWTVQAHPLAELREAAFRPQHIRPTGAEDPQPNPEDGRVSFRAYRDRDAELDQVVARAIQVAGRAPELSLGILVPTNAVGVQVAQRLRSAGQPYDERLRAAAASRQVAGLLAAALSVLAEPLRGSHLVDLYEALRPLASAGDPLSQADPDRLRPLLRSARPEQLLFPLPDTEPAEALPPVEGVDEEMLAAIGRLAERAARWMRARGLPVDQLLLTIAQDALPAQDQAVAERVAGMLRQRVEQEPERLLPDLAAELRSLASGRRRGWAESDDRPFEPRPGVITLTTMHKAKGLEWDLVYLVGVDGEWFPHRLEDRFRGSPWLGGDPAEEARAALADLIGQARHSGRSPTEAAHLELIAERLRLLYVGITRARRLLSVSWSQSIPRARGTPRPVPMAEAWRELKRFDEAAEARRAEAGRDQAQQGQARRDEAGGGVDRADVGGEGRKGS